MRRLLCEKCANGKQDGTRQVLPEGKLGEAAEYERVVWGTALVRAENRVMSINGTAIQLQADRYDCDQCSDSIYPGQRCCAWSLWAAYQAEVGDWEHEYLEPMI